MTDWKPKDSADVMNRLSYSRSLYSDAELVAAEVQKLLRGEYDVPQDLEDADITVVKPSKAMNLVTKHLQMLVGNAERRISVDQFGNTNQEARVADRLERVVRAFDLEHLNITRRDWMYDSAWFADTKGRAPIMTVYDPLRKGLRLRVRPLNPLTCFTVHGEDGVEWFCREYYKTRLELRDHFARYDPKNTKFRIPNLGEMDNSGRDYIRVVEYWNEKYHATVIEGDDGDSFHVREHEHGMVPLVEYRFNETPEDEQRWAFNGLLAFVLDELKVHAATMSKMATGVEQFYYPRLYYVTEKGHLMSVGPHDQPGDWAPMMPGVQPVILNPTPNQGVMETFLSRLEGEINKGTLSEAVFALDLPGANTSGNAIAQVLTQIKDAIADKQRSIERGSGHVYSHIVRLMERFGDIQPDKVWRLPLAESDRSKRRYQEEISADDIAGHYNVRVNIRASLPHDMMQMVTTYNQMIGPDPATGKPKWSKEAALTLTGLWEFVPDMSEMEEDIDWEFALTNDQELAQLNVANIKANNIKKIWAMKQNVAKYEKRVSAMEEKMAEKDAEAQAEEPLVIPPDKKGDVQVYQRMLTLAQQGKDPALALEDLPLGVPGQDQQQGPPGQPLNDQEMAALMASMQGQQPQQQPDGFTGYGGNDPQMMPAAQMGARYRPTEDPSLYPEQVAQQQRRGALPPPR